MLRVALVYTAVELLSLFDHENLVERFSTGIAEATRQTARMSPTTSLPELSFNHADAWWHNTKCISLTVIHYSWIDDHHQFGEYHFPW